MRQNFFLFLLSPMLLFATIEVANEPAKKQETQTTTATPTKEEPKISANAPATESPAVQPPAPKETPVAKKKPVITKKDAHKEVAVKEGAEDEEDFPASAASSPSYLSEGHQKQFFLTLILICVFILFALIVIYIFKRASPMSAITRKNSRNNIKILERRSLSPQTYLYHIQVGDKQFILSESKVEVRSVASLDWENPK